MTLNGVWDAILRYVTEFGSFKDDYVKVFEDKLRRVPDPNPWP